MALAVAQESRDFVDHYWEQGYAIVRGLFNQAEIAEAQAEAQRIYQIGLQHHATYRHKNLLFEILPESFAGRRYVMQAHWFSWISPFFERFRRAPQMYSVLQPLLGRNVRQIAQQLHWKPPGAPLSGYRMHQDLRFRERQEDFKDLMTTNINFGIAIDPATKENGCLRIVPGSHKKGYLGLADDGPIMKGTTQEQELIKAGLDPASTIDVELEPGDLAIWGLLTVHGSQQNKSDKDRCFMIQSYTKAENSDRGEWAFRDGISTPLGDEPKVCKYTALHEKPGPMYIDDKWYQS